MKKAVYQLEALTCPSCIQKIEKSLRKTKGVDTVKVLFHSSKVRVQFEEEAIEAEEIESNISRLGYPVLSTKVS
ncbi:heavy-metal-associated domain-containing protein [Alkalicoccus daliensis]|uniref:Copper chaperone CopZ n=1 Tax=Alkalicoccus daliensis TaxID=745820 RepID=A0A1H0HJS2_9BACI|nr:heavy-metal-associated domain-containing protein [Alkalicoccus daliensis]SDO19304.1 Copper chaperone CopZ [Alkalicoccus daliensis]